MKTCDNCKVNVHPQHEFCPLCGRHFGSSDQSVTTYPSYHMNGNKASSGLRKLMLFLAITISSIVIFINIFTFDQVPVFWSLLVTTSLFFIWSGVCILVTKKKTAGIKVLSVYALVSAYLVIIDFYSGFGKWSTTYVIPFLTIFVALMFTLLAVRSNKSFGDYAGSLIVVFIISFVPVILYLFSLSTQAWSGFVAMFYCLLTVLGLVMFKGRSFREEIKKQFHF